MEEIMKENPKLVIPTDEVLVAEDKADAAETGSCEIADVIHPTANQKTLALRPAQPVDDNHGSGGEASQRPDQTQIQGSNDFQEEQVQDPDEADDDVIIKVIEKNCTPDKLEDELANTKDSQNPESGTEKKKKKKNKKRKKKKNSNNPPKVKKTISGFEEYYVDVPPTSDEWQTERFSYDPEIPFTQRIETAIAIYRTRRKFTPQRKDIFDKWMRLGGVDIGQKQFTGRFNEEDFEGLSSADIALRKGGCYICYDKENNDDWEVDFEGVVKAFLSSRIPEVYGFNSEEQAKDYVNIIQNFLNYLLYHEVCPEYEDQINGALKVCKAACKEFWAIRQVMEVFPGEFNIACSTMFKGLYYENRKDQSNWDSDPNIMKEHIFQCGLAFKGFEDSKCQRIIYTALAALGTDEQLSSFHKLEKDGKLEVVKVKRVNLEITAVEFSDDGTKTFYKESGHDLRSVGRFRARYWTRPDFAENDLTEAEKEEIANAEKEEVEIWMEDEILYWCFKGLKIDVTLKEVNCGIKFVEEVHNLYCSFHTIILNELYAVWKEGSSWGIKKSTEGEEANEAKEAKEAKD